VLPIMAVDGFGDTVVLVVRRLTVSVDVPELPKYPTSPL